MATALPIIQDDVTRTSAELYGLNYLIYAIIFGCTVVPLSCLELDEQVPLQVMLTGCRFLMFFLMIGTSHLCAEDQEDILLSTGKEDSVETIHVINQPDNFKWSGLPKTLPILIFANIFHHSIPGLTSPMADKKKIGGVFTATNAFTTSSYLILGLTLGTAFGKSIHQSSNLNWNNFNAGTGDIDDRGNVINSSWWTHAISMYIIMFPAIDVVSAYPLNAITLGNNLFNAVYGKRIHEVEKNRFLRTSFRLMASVPPIIFGILVRQLGVITDYTGTTGFLIGLSFPAILYVASKKIAKRKHFNENTFYTRFGSNTIVARSMFWFGIFMMIAVFLTLTFGELMGL
jgi:amino acid permease